MYINLINCAGDVYSAQGEGVVFVNYGRIEDFQQLEEMGVNVSGKIAMMRFGEIFRGNKVSDLNTFLSEYAILYQRRAYSFLINK